MNYRAQLVCAWLGLVASLLMFAALLPLMRFVPPPAPSLSAAEIAAIYRGNATGIIVGCIILQLAAMLFMPFFGALVLQLSRMESPSKLWTYSFLVVTALGFAPFLIAELLFSIAAYRPERPDEIITAISDLGFIMLVGAALPGSAQMLCLAIPALADRQAEPVFPRWIGYFSIWTAILAVPGCLVALFKTGPFAWNGLLAFWVALFAFGAWVMVCFWGLRRALLRQMRG